MRILVLGSKLRHQRSTGFTLLELLIVITIIAIGSAGVSFAFRDSAQAALDREADKIAAELEAARVKSRSTGIALVWVAHRSESLENSAPGYSILPASAVRNLKEPQTQWKESAFRVAGEKTQLILGPEPMLAAQSITLVLGERKLRIATDGLRPFRVEAL